MSSLGLKTRNYLSGKKLGRERNNFSYRSVPGLSLKYRGRIWLDGKGRYSMGWYCIVEIGNEGPERSIEMDWVSGKGGEIRLYGM